LAIEGKPKSRNWKWNSGSTRPSVTNEILRNKNIEHIKQIANGDFANNLMRQ
jgi:hypothetical protein